MRNLKELWENNDFMLVGVQNTYRQEIDRDQAIDENGAAYKSYILKKFDEYYEFTAKEIEEFAKTW